MQLTRDVVRAAQAVSSTGGRRAPREVLAALVSLQPPDEVATSLSWCSEGGPGTTWRVLWLAVGSLTYCEGEHPSLPDWCFESPAVDGPDEVELDAWTTPVDRIGCVRVVGLGARPAAGGMHVALRRVVEVVGVGSLSLPLGGDVPQWRDDDLCDEFVRQLRLQLSARRGAWPSVRTAPGPQEPG